MSRERRPGSASVAEVATRAVVLRRLELEVLRKLDGIASGDHATTGIGPGSERAGAREYVPGDDGRLIDWNLTARSATTYVRNTVAEREVDTWIVPDRSASMDFGTARAEKSDVVLGAAAAIGMLTVRGHNRLGLLVAGTQQGTQYPPKTGRVWLMAVLSAIYDTPRQEGSPDDSQDIAAAMSRLLVAQQRRSQIVVISDFLGADRWISRCAPSPYATKSSRSMSPIHASSPCPRWDFSQSSTPRPVGSDTCRPHRRWWPAMRRRRKGGRPTSPARSRRLVPSISTFPPRATGSPTRCCSRPAAKDSAAPRRSTGSARTDLCT